MGTSLALSFVVLLITTRNLRIATFAIMTIVCIVSALFGTMFMAGLDLGTVGNTILIGNLIDLSVTEALILILVVGLR